MAKDENVHKGHRQKMFAKFSKFGIDVFPEHEKLEIILYFIIPRQNTNVIAHNLISKFGTLKAVLSAPLDELQKIKGIGEKAALMLRFFGALGDYISEMQLSIMEDFSSNDRVREFCADYFANNSSEAFLLLLLDDKYALLDTCDLKNMPTDSEADCREVFRKVTIYDCRKIIIAHNRPHGTADPSDEDLKRTRKLCKILSMIEVALVDHIIVTPNETISLRRCGLLNDVWEN